MKKYLFGLGAVVLAISFSAFTKPVSKAKPFTNYYIFDYQLGTYTSPQVADRSVTSWGTGTLTTSSSLNTVACNNILHKACQILVEESYVKNAVIGGVTKKVLRTPTDGAPFVTIGTAEYATDHTFYVNNSTNLTDDRDKF